MAKADVVEQVADVIGPRVAKKECGLMVDAFLDALTDALARGDRIELRGFGTFKVRHRKARTGRNPKAEDAARAAICAEEQGRFQQIHSLLFGSTEWRDIGDWKTLAENAGVADLAAYESCLMGEATGRRLEEDMRLGEALGVTSTPTFFYQFGRHVGYATEEQFLELIEQSR